MCDLICDCKENYTNLVTSVKIGACLSDLSEFIVNSEVHNTVGNINIYNIGIINNIQIFVDPYMSYNDDRLVLFNNVEVNTTDITPSIQLATTFTPRLIINYQLDYNVGDSKIIFVLENSNSESFRQYKSLQRDIKIDNLLN